ncbi:MAG TPA: tetratricopeptide repeat protein, partial [Polyangiaceae bacterium]|nr:tetratricopeptide repeat protein [Polyangiaceae bacterium]
GQVAEQIKDRGAKARFHLLSALDFARHAADAGAARRALEAAAPSADNPGLLPRVARTLAFAAGDASWFAAATESLLETETSSLERTGLLLERWRAAVLAGEVAEQQRLEAALELLPEGRVLSQLARAHARTPASEAANAGVPEAEALLGLAEQASDVATRTALEWTAALRWLAADQPDRARALLEKLHREHPAQCVVAGTLSALCEGSQAAAPQLAELLARTGAAIDDAEFAASLLIEAGLRHWQARPSAAAAQHFEQAERRRPGSALALAHWARRGSERSFGAWDERGAEPAERLLGALERAARADGVHTKQLAELQAALRALGDADASPLATAARLLVLLLGRALGLRSDPALLERLAALHPDASRLVDAWRYLECIAQSEPAPQAFEEVTRKWSESSESLASALEWVAATERLAQPAREVRARFRASEFLPGVAGEQCAASAALVAQISGAAPAPFLTGTSPQLLLTNLETSPPGCDPRRRALALEGAAPLLGPDAEPSLALLRGYNLLATGDGPGALAAFQRYAEAFPDDPAGFEGLLAAARHDDDPVQLAEATAALGRTSRDPAHAARLFEEAAVIFFDQLHDVAAGEAALSRAVELDIRRKSSFDRLFAWVRDSDDAARLLDLCERRLAVQVSPEEVRELEWERARAARQLGDTRTAANALDRVLGVDRNHVGALTLLGEIYITTQRYPEAADVLAKLTSLEGASSEQRLQSGLYAVDLFENQLDATGRALEVLLSLHRAGLSTLPVRERLARAAAKSESWDDAVIVLEQLMFERSTPEERAEAARLALAIHRDRRHDVRSAGHAVEALLTHLPHDAEALDLALGGELDPELTDRLLRQGEQALAQRLRQDPFQLDSLRRLARIADRTGSLALRQVSLGALVALGHGPSSGARAELAALDQRICTTPSVAWTPELLSELADPADQGPIAQLLALVAPHLTAALGPDLKTFQVTRRERILPSSGLPIRNEVAAWVGALGLGDFELYQSAVAADRIVALATEPLSVILGSRVTAPLGPFQRQELVRSLYALSRQRGVLTQLDELEVAALVVALCQLGQVTLAAPNYARQGDFERQLSRALPRKVKKLLPDYALGVQQGESDVAGWVRTALTSLDRAATLVVGDISLVLSDSSAAERSGSVPAPPTERTRRLASFVLAPEF